MILGPRTTLHKLYAESIVYKELGNPRNVWNEIVSLNSSINTFLKKFGIGYDIKTFDQEKGAAAEFRKILRNLISSDKSVSPADIEEEIKSKIVEYKGGEANLQEYEIQRIARTEASSLREARKLLRWKEMGFSKVKHSAYLTKATGKRDREFNGKIFDINYLLNHEKERIPLHPNCRCTYILEG